MKPIKWNREEWPIDRLTPWEKNPRTRNPKQFPQLVESVRKFGLPQPIVVQPDGVIIGGHQRYAAALEAGMESVPVVFPSKPLPQKAFEELNIRLNRNIAGDWDKDVLRDFFSADDLSDYGFEDWELDFMSGGGSGGDDPGIPGDFNPPPPSNVRMFQLFLNDENYSDFLARVKDLEAEFGVDNPTDAVLRAVEEVHSKRREV